MYDEFMYVFSWQLFCEEHFNAIFFPQQLQTDD